MTEAKPSIGVLGMWHLGCIYATSFAKLGFNVTGYDLNKKVINELNASKPPIFEPGLDDELKHSLGKKLFFSLNPRDAIKDKKYVFVTLDVPVSDKDKINIKPLNRLLDLIIKHASPNTTVVISSQAPLGTSRAFLKKITKKLSNAAVIYFPENIRLGTAFETFLDPDRIILGSEKESTFKQFTKDFSNFTCPVFAMNLESAEMVKHALNSFLAVSISFASEISDLCEILGANYDDVLKSLRAESRIGNGLPLNPGTGFAGGTIGRDVQNLKMLVKNLNYKPLLLKAAYKVNQNRLTRLLKKVAKLYPNPKGKKVGILGLTYKPGTNTLRRSKSLELANFLHNEGMSITALDPAITDPIPSHPYIRVTTVFSEFFRNLDLTILMTPWPEFKQISSKDISTMKNKTILDTINMLDISEFDSQKVKYYRTGNSFPQ